MVDITKRYMQLITQLIEAGIVKDNKEFAILVGVSVSSITEINKGRSNIGLAAIHKTVSKFPEINLEWLISGNGNIFKTKCVQNATLLKGGKNGGKNGDFPNVQETPPFAGVEYLSPLPDDNFTEVPIADISVAAGGGAINSEYYEVNGSIKLPKSMLSSGKHLCVKVDGRSMEPTLPHASKVVIRLLDRNEWRSIKDDRVYVVTDREGGTYIKRCTNRLHSEGLLILISDNSAYPPFNLPEEELHHVWAVEWFMMSHLPNKRAKDEAWRNSIESDVAEMRQQLTKVLRVIEKEDLKHS